MAQQEQLSPLDEYVYADYLDKVDRGGVAQQGETFDDYAMSLGSCRGVGGYGLIGSPCGGPYQLKAAPYGGVTSADIHAPTYFVLTAGVAQVIQWTGATRDLLTAGRLAGAVWLALGVSLTALLARRLGASRLLSALAGGLVAVSPATRWSNTYITPDALNLVCGAAIALVGLHVVSRRRGEWLLFVTAAIVASVKAQNVLAVGVVGLLLIVTALAETGARSRARWRLALTGAVSVLVAIGVQVGWLLYRSASAVGPAADQQLGGEQFQPRLLLADMVALMRGAVIGPLNHVSPLGEALAWVTTAGVVGTVFVAGLTTVNGRLATSTVVGLLVGGPVLSILAFAMSGSQFPTQPRYGMSLLALLAALAVALIRARWVGVLGLVAVSCVYLTLVLEPGTW